MKQAAIVRHATIPSKLAPIEASSTVRQSNAVARNSFQSSIDHDQLGLDEIDSLRIHSLKTLPSDFPSVYFLDHDVFQHSKIDLLNVDAPLDPVIAEAIERPAAITARYFTWVHLWMPIISKSRFLFEYTGPLTKPRSDVKILLFCMKLVMWSPKLAEIQQEPKTNGDYLTAKRAFLTAEAAGLLSLQLLQAMILTAIYEYAHAVYPAAYITIGACVRHGLALKIDKQCKGELESESINLEDQEERRRVWWAIVVLDRVVSQWSPTSPDPRPGDLLPVHDQDWDDGVIDSSRILPVSSPSNINMGMFSRLAQAAYLLGRVQRHRNSPTGDAQFDMEERVQLDRSLRALLNLTYQEGASHLMPICPQTAICFTALIKLHSSPMLLSSENDGVHEAGLRVIGETLTVLRPIAQESCLNTDMYFRREPWSMEKSSPLLLHSTYSVAVAFLKVGHCLQLAKGKGKEDFDLAFLMWDRDEMRREASEGFQTMKLKLTLLGTQWSAADEYLRILDARETGKIP